MIQVTIWFVAVAIWFVAAAFWLGYRLGYAKGARWAAAATAHTIEGRLLERLGDD